MTSKITEAIHQLKKSIGSLDEAIPSLRELADEKQQQIINFRHEYFKTHPEALAGEWDIFAGFETNYVQLTGWYYDDRGTTGIALIDALDVHEDEGYVQINLGDNDTYNYCNGNPAISLILIGGEVRIDFHNMELSDVVTFLKKYNITLNMNEVDKRIAGFTERISELDDFKSSIMRSGLIKNGVNDSPLVVPEIPDEEENPSPTQFNSEEVSALHKRVGIAYEYLTNIVTPLHDSPADTELVEHMVHALFILQTELDMIAVMVGDLDTKDEPEDIGMAGCSYWNILDAAKADLNDAIKYMKVDMPMLPEIQHRLLHLQGVLNDCAKEFEENWLNK